MQMEQIQETEFVPAEIAPENNPGNNANEEPKIDPNNPPWGVWTAIGVWAASIMFIILLPNLALLPYMLRQNLDLSNEALLREFAQTDPMAVILQMGSIFPAHLLTLLIAWAVATRFNKFSFRKTFGWTNDLRWWDYSMLLGGFVILVYVVSYFFPEQDNDLIRILESSRTALYIVAFLATFTAPLVEEVIYRGILFSALQRSAGVVWAVLLVTVLFAGVHFAQYWGSPGSIFLICFLSLVLTLLRYRTKSLLPCIILHTLINGLQSLLLVFKPLLSRYATEETPQAALQAIIHLIK
jgi:membrane protease YdiL (CAAX protease family)